MDERDKRLPGNAPAHDGPGGHPAPRWSGSRAIWSALVIGASLLLALAIYFGLLSGAWIDAIARWTASGSSAALNLFGLSTSVNGTVLASDSFAVEVVAECTVIGPLLVYMGAVLAYPSPLRAKSLGWALGLVVLTGLNIGRIMSLFWIGSTFPEYLGVAHLLVWQTAIILLAIVLWLIWVERFAHARHG